MTSERDITPKYVKTHSNEFSIKVKGNENGTIQFELSHDVTRPMYHVAHLTVVANGKLLVDTSTPSFGKMHGNIFYFSIAREFLAASKFDLTDSALAGPCEDAVPVPGTVINRFRLLDFVPKKLLQPSSK
ncbi:MAG TPA: hypothetical protein VFW73_03205 [Lacipirellulaceae bacterium]|nr:hypothetical protein [Lacipirellulaceae bacterium]